MRGWIALLLTQASTMPMAWHWNSDWHLTLALALTWDSLRSRTVESVFVLYARERGLELDVFLQEPFVSVLCEVKQAVDGTGCPSIAAFVFTVHTLDVHRIEVGAGREQIALFFHTEARELQWCHLNHGQGDGDAQSKNSFKNRNESLSSELRNQTVTTLTDSINHSIQFNQQSLTNPSLGFEVQITAGLHKCQRCLEVVEAAGVVEGCLAVVICDKT